MLVRTLVLRVFVQPHIKAQHTAKYSLQTTWTLQSAQKMALRFFGIRAATYFGQQPFGADP